MIDIPLIIIGAIVGTLGGIVMGWIQSKSFVKMRMANRTEEGRIEGS